MSKTAQMQQRLLLAIALPYAVVATLPANVGTRYYLPGDPTPSFSVPLLPESPTSPNASLNATVLAYSEGAKPVLPGPRSSYFPLVVLAVRPDDPFVGYMAHAAESIDKFIAMGPSGCHFLF
eukprot:SAG11_NODE_17595_length_514_cov_0.619277_1_plen_121_part_01